jgi:hypothetical protein
VKLISLIEFYGFCAVRVHRAAAVAAVYWVARWHLMGFNSILFSAPRSEPTAESLTPRSFILSWRDGDEMTLSGSTATHGSHKLIDFCSLFLVAIAGVVLARMRELHAKAKKRNGKNSEEFGRKR